jgi:hypothetical protein
MAHRGVDGKKFQPDLDTGNWSSNSWQVLTVDTMYVGLLVIAVLGFVFSLVLDDIERMLIPWKANARGVRCPRRYALRMEISAG